jgi:general secretion pathway protein B
MSFILDALRKSEQERQRNEQPGIADVRYQKPNNSWTVWMPLVILLVVINISLLLFLWLRGSPAATVEPIAVRQSAPVQLSAPAAQPATNPGYSNRRLASELMPDEQATAAPAAPQTQTQTQTQNTPAASAPASSSNSDGNLPTLTELTLAGSMELPPLRLDIHVFSNQPSERFVFINMAKYREGDTLKEGPVLNAITDSGAVLSYQGRKFLVTRQ